VIFVWIIYLQYGKDDSCQWTVIGGLGDIKNVDAPVAKVV